jgi:hypothetical protein
VGIVSVLQQGGAGRCTAPSDVALIEHDYIVTLASRFISDQRVGEAGAHHSKVASDVGIERSSASHSGA